MVGKQFDLILRVAARFDGGFRLKDESALE